MIYPRLILRSYNVAASCLPSLCNNGTKTLSCIKIPNNKLALRLCSSSTKNKSELERKPTANISIKDIIIEDIGIDKHDIDVSETVKGDGWSAVTSVKYETFDTGGSQVIHDISEEELSLIEPQQPQKIKKDAYETIRLKRGKNGVFDVEELVELLKDEKVNDVIAMQIPASAQFVDHMVIVSANNQRHLNAIALTVRHVYNKKMNRRKDSALILEGRDSPWVAMDMGNIALHIMSPAERRRVDIESLWLCGPAHDLKLREDAEAHVDDLFTLADPIENEFVDEKPYDLSKEYDHPFIPISEDEVLPDFEEINDGNRQQYSATSIMEMALRKHNKELSKKYRGRFKK